MGRRVLLVEDDPLVRRALVGLLQRRGAEVDAAECLAEALEKIDAMPEWVILDLMLPDGDGRDVLRRIRAAGLPIRAIVTTGVVMELESLQEFNPAAVLPKPITLAQIVEAMGG